MHHSVTLPTEEMWSERGFCRNYMYHSLPVVKILREGGVVSVEGRTHKLVEKGSISLEGGVDSGSVTHIHCLKR